MTDLNKSKDGWRLSTWGEEIELKYGKAIRGYKGSDKPYPVYGTNGKVGSHTDYLTRGPGVILGRKGAYRGVHFSEVPFFVIDTAYYVKPISNMDMRWLYYAMKYYKVGEIDDGSPIPSTTRAAVYTYDFWLPPVGEQTEISNALAVFDDKIEVNRRMNAVLEGMARAVFVDWFVDFGPTRRKMAGEADPVKILGGAIRPPAQAQKTAALFPDRLGENGLPEGWEEKPLSELAKIKNGFAFKSKDWATSGRPVLKIRNVKPSLVNMEGASFVSEAIAEKNSLFKIDTGSALVGMTGYVGDVGRVPPSKMRPLLNQRVGQIVPSYRATFSPFCYTACRLEEFKVFAEMKSHGSAQANVSAKALMQYPLIFGALDTVEAFDQLFEPLYEMQLQLFAENQTLAEMRDLLLPKLMSGEIRLREGG